MKKVRYVQLKQEKEAFFFVSVRLSNILLMTAKVDSNISSVIIYKRHSDFLNKIED
jgi:hypothetical protein